MIVAVPSASPACYRCALSSLAIAAIAGSLPAQPPPPPINVPADFEVMLVAAAPLISAPMLGGFDDRGRLFLAESTGLNLDENGLAEQTPNRIRMLEDTDDDGIFDRSTIFADRLTFPQGVQWHDGALYVASPPSIWRLEDTDGDGCADSRKEIATGFKYTGNAADVHGPFLHPNGRLYWCHGRKGHEVYQRDGSLVSKGLGARVWSCRPDGTDIQVHAGGGMDNPVELAFNQEGDIFGTANIFNSSPRNDAVIHWVHGGVYPYLERVLPEFRSTGRLLSAAASLGHVAPAGIVLKKSEAWGVEFRDNLFLAEFNTRRIMRLRLERDRATFRGRPEVFVSTADTDIHFTDVIEDADGSLLIINTGAWFRRGCPMSGAARPDVLGSIYRIRHVGASPAAEPRGNSIHWAQIPAGDMVKYLGDSRPAVRERAVSELAKKEDTAVAELRGSLCHDNYLSRSNAVWALTRIGSPAAQTAVRQALADTDFRVRQAACQSAFVTADRDSFDQLARLLSDEALPVRREAARALGRLRNSKAIPYLAEAVIAGKDDPVMTHALIYALIEVDDPPALHPLLVHSHPGIRRAGLIALDQIPRGNIQAQPVFAALRSPDASLRAATAEIAIRHPEWGGEAADYFEFAFAESAEPEHAKTGARLLPAFLAAPEVREWLRTRFMPAGSLSSAALDPRIAIEAIANAPGTWDESWRELLTSALTSPDGPLAAAALRAMTIHRTRDFSLVLRTVARDSTRATAFRVSALQLAVGDDTVMDDVSFEMLIEPFTTGGSPDARLHAASVLANATLRRSHVLRLIDLLPVAGPTELPLLLGVFKQGPADANVASLLIATLQAAPGRWGIDPRFLQRLFQRYPASAAEKAVPMISELIQQTNAKDSRLKELEKSAAGGDAVRGRAAFFAGAGACIGCHRIDGTGGIIGPDLSRIGRSRTRRDLLEAITFPDATIARGYESFQIETRDGVAIVGTILRETNETVFVLTGDGRESAVLRGSISKLEPVTSSLMPAGLDRALDPGTLADLIAYLKSLQ